MALLFEYGEWVGIKSKNAVKQLLKDIWQKQLFVDMTVELPEEGQDSRYQPFLTFDDDKIRANNFIGFVTVRE